MTLARTCQVLLVDDDEGHVELVRRNLVRSGLCAPITAVDRGEAALDFLHARGAWAGRNRELPLLLLLDIKMPGSIDGLEVLRRVKGDARTRLTPVFMLTTTDDPNEIRRCYELGCNAYLSKPVEPERFVEEISRLGSFLGVVRAPVPRGAAS
jgi:CheY-like chemotaxis protein